MDFEVVSVSGTKLKPGLQKGVGGASGGQGLWRGKGWGSSLRGPGQDGRPAADRPGRDSFEHNFQNPSVPPNR